MAALVKYNSLREGNIVRQKLWDPDSKLTLEFRGLELAGESGEVCNKLKKLVRQKLGLRGSRTTITDFADELADVIICVDLIAMHLGINLSDAIVRTFNNKSNEQGFPIHLSLTDVGILLDLPRR